MKSIKFKNVWCAAIAHFPVETRCEIYAATMMYSLENRQPDGMSDLAKGAFAFIKADIDAARNRRRSCSETVSEDAKEQASSPLPVQSAEAETPLKNDALPEPRHSPAAEPAPASGQTVRPNPSYVQNRKHVYPPRNARPRRKPFIEAVGKRLAAHKRA